MPLFSHTYLASAAQIREMDRIAIKDRKMSGKDLMEAAGGHTARGMLDTPLPEGPVAILCGGGNNGGDGFVIARHLARAGKTVEIMLLSNPDKLKGDARANFQLLPESVRLFEVDDDTIDFMEDRLLDAGCIVDALLGTGLERDVEGLYAKIIRIANDTAAWRVAVDMPSGVNADTGAIMGIAFEAHATYTYGLAKLGQLKFPGADYCGRLVVVDIGIPEDVIAQVGVSAEVLTEPRARAALTPRALDSHKGSFGHLLLIAGGPGKSGAAILAAQAAVRSGVGLVTCLTDADTRRSLAGSQAEAMSDTWLEGDTNARLAAALESAKGKQALAIGPGWGVNDSNAEILTRLLEELADIPMVLDADALTLITGKLDLLKARHARGGVTILTPHPGEAGRLLGLESAEVQADRMGAAERLRRATDAIVVLKGANTVIAAEGRLPMICPHGNPGMATGGAGDTLTGLLGGILATGMDAFEATSMAVGMHAVAGDIAVKEMGQRGLIASDLIWSFGQIWAAWERGENAL